MDERLRIDSKNVYERIYYKCRNNICKLDAEERDALEDLLVDNFCNKLMDMNDEELMQSAKDRGILGN